MSQDLQDTNPNPSPIPPLSPLTPETGKKLGIALTTKHADESIDQRIHNALGKINGLEDLLSMRFPHFQMMMVYVLRNKIIDVGEGRERARETFSKIKRQFTGYNTLTGYNNKVDVEPAHSQDTQLDEISASDAIRIGKKFALLLLTTTEPSAAVDSWLKDNKELKHFVADNIWFEPMMNAIAKKLLKSSNLGLKWRVVLGAILSIG